MAACTNCTTRPRQTGTLYCYGCAKEMDKANAVETARKSTKGRFDKYCQVIAWKGEFVGFECIEDKDNYFAPTKHRFCYLGSDVRGVPKAKLVVLDTWHPELTAQKVKGMKNLVRRLSPFFNITKSMIA